MMAEGGCSGTANLPETSSRYVELVPQVPPTDINEQPHRQRGRLQPRANLQSFESPGGKKLRNVLSKFMTPAQIDSTDNKLENVIF
jgi:hypothetical protein